MIHLDFITGGWKALPHHSCYLLRETGSGFAGEVLHLSSCFGGFCLSSSFFPLLLVEQLHLHPFYLPLKSCVFMQKSEYWYACQDGSEDWSIRQLFYFKSALLGLFPHASPFFPTLLRKFLLPLPCLAVAPEKSELSLSRPQDREHLATCLVGSPGAQRLWTDWLPLWKKKKKRHRKTSHTAVAIVTFAATRAKK